MVHISIRTMRKRKGLSQKELATVLGVDQSAVALWERGISGPLSRRLPQIAQVLGCTVDELLAQDAPADGGQ